MKKYICSRFSLSVFLVFISVPSISFLSEAQVDSGFYSRGKKSLDGTGKFYMGREISQVMGHLGASWLERSERAEEEEPDQLIRSIPLNEGDVVADIGAGTGFFTWRMALEVGLTGKVYAVDIQPEMLNLCNINMRLRGIDNVQTVLGTQINPGLPESTLDLVLMVDVYHEFSHPYEMIQGILRELKPSGILVFVEYRGEDPRVPIKPLHKMTESQVIREASIHPLRWIETKRNLPRQHVILFQKLSD